MEYIKNFTKNHIKLIIFSLSIIVISLSVCSYIYYRNYKSKDKQENTVALVEKEIPNTKEEINQDEEIKKIKVDIKGAITTPGVYEVDEGTIVNDLISLAGGITKYGTTKNINLSRKLIDEMVIIIYTQSELKDMTTTLSSDCITSDTNINNCYTNKQSVVIPNTKNTDVSNNDITIKEDNKIISINTASKEELMTLSGIGEAKAENIIKYREENNGFKTLEEIMNISGIGEAVFAKIKDSITL